MQIRLKTLRRIIREVAEYSALNIKPGMVLRYTGGDMEMPNMLKVLKVVGGDEGMTIVAGDQHGQTHKIPEKELHGGDYEVTPTRR